ncbi:hypothetical protein [Mucilaginibacter polytrichastri]|uniref:Acetylxylan esterase n=1 Tax=Mucilaginibacter polytrichastri TaxID=1302689 RepID=A0A1Q5ZVS0_9SPHI|nr:hypothetical protein [Mucilaginibacter polytrichastri]OKS85865.1 hypothetical protein RG47T_1311 [Mucilaginibacter polytrichastri]SFS60961.1 hypothetical protein SAMN04487890_102268 [Mucilaginibacter polytrichastri]
MQTKQIFKSIITAINTVACSTAGTIVQKLKSGFFKNNKRFPFFFILLTEPGEYIKRKVLLLGMGVIILVGSNLQARSAASKYKTNGTAKSDTTRSLAPYFTPAKASKKTPDADGFIQRWLLLEPINKPIRSNAIFTDSYLRTAFTTEYFPNQFTVMPKDGEKVKVAEQELTWHALESTNFNVKLFRFAYGLRKQTYGVLFWAVTIVNCPQEMKNVRMAVGSNSASMWWLNGKEAVLLSGDRRMVMDDCVSTRLTLHKGKNIIRGAVINGPGMSDFCVRFLDEKGVPIKDLTISYQ